MSYIFVGEKPSKTAFEKGWTWENGRLAGKQLFDAFDTCGIKPDTVGFINLFGEHPDVPEAPDLGIVATLRAAARAGVTIVGMGRKVQKHLADYAVPYRELVHPAARGLIRDKHRYADHLKEVLK